MNETIPLVEQYNPWWQSGAIPEKYKSEKKRPSYLRVFLAADAWFQEHKVLLMEGPRQVGKTHILHHLVQKYLDIGVPQNRIVYINVQDPRFLNVGSLNDLIQTCLTHIESQGGSSKHPEWKALILLDEVQYADKWSDWLKTLADRHDFPAKIIATGSALRLSRGTRESGAGRWKVIDIPHLSFFEYINLIKPVTSDSLGFPELPDNWDWKNPIDGLLPKIRSALPFEKLTTLLNEYLAKGGYPDPAKEEVVSEAQETIRTGILSLVLQDPVDLKIVRGKLELQRLFYYLSTHTAEILSKDTIGKESGLNRLTLSEYLQCLQDIHLIESAPLYKNDGTLALKSHDKTYVATPCIASALRPRESVGEKRGLILESAVAMHVLQDLKGNNGFLSYWRDKPDGQEVDIIAHWGEEVIPIEVKSQGKKSGMLRFLEKYQAESRSAYLLKDRDEWNWSTEKRKVGVTMPIAHFLYMLGWRENHLLQKRFADNQSSSFVEKPIEIILPEGLTDLKSFQRKTKQSFLSITKNKTYFRLIAGPENLLKTGWETSRSTDDISHLLKYPPKIREMAHVWHPGLEGIAEPELSSDGLGSNFENERKLFLYSNGTLEFFINLQIGTAIREKNRIYPYALVEYTVNFFRLFKRLAQELSLKEPYWCELDIVNMEGLELRAGHPQSVEYLFDQMAKTHRFGPEPFPLSARIPQLNPFKVDDEAFQVLSNLYSRLGLQGGLPFFDKDGTCRIQ